MARKKTKYTIDDVRRIFGERGCKLLSTEYRRQNDKLDYICLCGNEAKISLDKFLLGQLCRKCKGTKISERQRFSYDYISKYFKDHGATLLATEYVNGHTRMPYICECGTESEISYSKFRSGQRCYKCKSRKISEKLSGPNNPFYKHDKTDEERIRDRKYPEYYEWRRSVYERDDYTCQKCFEKGGKINAHHIEAYSRDKDLRTAVSNGITLCEDCHKQYHEDFYRNDATEESFLEYMRGEYNGPPPYVV